MTSTFYVEILERFQWKAFRMIVAAPWYMPNTVIRTDLQTPTVKEEIRHYSSQQSAHISVRPNDLVVNLMVQRNTGDCEHSCHTIYLGDS
jgi:hypothetical protein